MRTGVRLNIRGRTIRVRAIQAPGTGIIGFLAFLYFIPPFMFMKPEEFSGPAGKAGPDLSKIVDPGERAIAGPYEGSCREIKKCFGPH